MATESAVLGVMRGSRPQLRCREDRLAFAVHSAFLASGFSLAAVGSRVSEQSQNLQGVEGEEEVGIEGWNDLEGAYAFQYRGPEQGQPSSVIVKCVSMGDVLMVDAVAIGGNSTGKPLEPFNLEIKVSDYCTDYNGSNIGQLFKNLPDLIGKVNSQLISQFQPEKATSSSQPRENNDDSKRYHERDEHPGIGTSLIDDYDQSSRFVIPPVPTGGYDDRMPGLGAGVFPNRVGGGLGGGMLLGPNDPSFNMRIGPGQRARYPDAGFPGVPPGARFDPFGPPGIPGFEPDRFTRNPRRPPGGGTHPDLEHFGQFD